MSLGALASTNDPAHERAIALSRSLAPEKIITTDDVPSEYLAFFADARSHVRFEAGEIVAELIQDPNMRVAPHSRETVLDGLRGEGLPMFSPTTGILSRKAFGRYSGIPDLRSTPEPLLEVTRHQQGHAKWRSSLTRGIHPEGLLR